MRQLAIALTAATLSAIPASAEVQRQHTTYQQPVMSETEAPQISLAKSPVLKATRMLRDMKSAPRVSGSAFPVRYIDLPNAGGGTGGSAAVTARYRDSYGMFFTGLSADGRIGPHWALGGARGQVGFRNKSVNGKSYNWTVPHVVGFDEKDKPVYENREFSVTNLEMDIAPGMRTAPPTLTATNGSRTSTYTSPNVDALVFGGDAASWGLFRTVKEGNETVQRIYGMNTCPVPYTQLSGFNIVNEFGINKGAHADNPDYVDENGVSVGWMEFMKVWAKEQGATAKAVKLNGVSTLISAKSSAFLIHNMWIVADYLASDDVELTATIYPVDGSGVTDLSSPLGTASCILEKNIDNPSSDLSFLPFDFNAYDSEGFLIDAAIAITEPVSIVITGLDNENLLTFLACTKADTMIPADATSIEDYYATNARVELSVTCEYQGEESVLPISCPCPFIYGDGDTVYTPTDFCWFFNVDFPVLTPSGSEPSAAEITLHLPVDGGITDHRFDVSYLLRDLMDEGLVTVIPSSSWFTLDVTDTENITTGTDGAEQNNSYSTISITSKPLPAASNRRSGTIFVNGYGMDCAITVVQDRSYTGIDGIAAAAPADTQAEYYDLQGRRLNAAPTSGIYIIRRGDTAVKCSAGR